MGPPRETSTREQKFEMIIKQNYLVLEFYGRIEIYHFRVELATLNVSVMFLKPKHSHFPPGNHGSHNDIETTNKLAHRKQNTRYWSEILHEDEETLYLNHSIFHFKLKL